MDNNTLRDNFREQLANVHALTVLTVSFVEIIGYMVLVHYGVQQFSTDNRYLRYCVVLPILVNMVTHLAARLIVHNGSVPRNTKNTAIILAAMITSFVVAVCHKEYIVTSCAFVFPMLLSAIFSDRKLLNASFLGALFILAGVWAVFRLDGTGTLTTTLNLLVLVAFAFVAYLCARISINFSHQTYTTIEWQEREKDWLLDHVQRDQMTGLYNHAAFVSQLNEMVEKAGDDNPFCLAMIDMDDFKQINDQFGHDCGDDVLVYAANIIRHYSGKIGIAYRYGGEEFAIIFPKKSAGEVHDVMQEMLRRLRNHRFDFDDISITFSSSVVEYSEGLTSHTLFALADQTLYLAKRAGKNQVLIAC